MTPQIESELRCQYATESEDNQPQVNNRTTTNAVRNNPERDLKNCLGQAVGAYCQAYQGRRRT